MRIPKTDEELLQMASEIKERKIFLECFIPDPSLAPIIFLPLGYLQDINCLENIGAFLLYQYVSESTSEILGYPIFHSMLWLTKEESEKLRDYLGEIIFPQKEEGEVENES